MRDFHVGDRVELINMPTPFYQRLRDGATGRVCVELTHPADWVGVEWDSYISGHTCGGNCKAGYGYYVPKNTLAIISTRPELDTTAFEELM